VLVRLSRWWEEGGGLLAARRFSMYSAIAGL